MTALLRDVPRRLTSSLAKPCLRRTADNKCVCAWNKVGKKNYIYLYPCKHIHILKVIRTNFLSTEVKTNRSKISIEITTRLVFKMQMHSVKLKLMVCFGTRSRGRDGVSAQGTKNSSLPAFALFRTTQQPHASQAVHEHFREKCACYINICLCVSVCLCFRGWARGYDNAEPLWHMGSQHPSSLCSHMQSQKRRGKNEPHACTLELSLNPELIWFSVLEFKKNTQKYPMGD